MSSVVQEKSKISPRPEAPRLREWREEREAPAVRELREKNNVVLYLSKQFR